MVKKQTHIAAPIHNDLYELTSHVINKMREGTSARQHLNELIALIMKLTESGMSFYFIEPLERVKAGLITTKAAQLGLSSTQKGMKMVIQNVLGRLDDEQLLKITEFIEEIMFKGDKATKK